MLLVSEVLPMFCYFIVPYSWVHLNAKQLLQKSGLIFSMFLCSFELLSGILWP
jgi:hypothetical protein